jgi:hypothetical protein
MPGPRRGSGRAVMAPPLGDVWLLRGPQPRLGGNSLRMRRIWGW